MQTDGRIVVVGESGAIPSFALTRYATGTASAGGPDVKSLAGAIVYPNPVAGDRIRLDYELHESGPLTVHLTSLSGAHVIMLLKDQPRLKGRHTEDLVLPPDLATGVYLLQISHCNELLGIRVLKQ